MAVRTTPADVLLIMDNVTLSDSIVNAYITSANVMVNEVLGTGTSDLLTEIEKWLAAHFIAITRERQLKKAEAGSAKVEYGGDFGMFLRATMYGQTVLQLDTSGAFEALVQETASIYAIETDTFD